jgi:UDP-N-acetylglucosamine 4,6-dehydratase
MHAAAIKRIETAAYNPGELVKTNVLGTANVCEAAQDAGVRRVVYLSTDKAVAPVSPYGHSKALGEALVLAADRQARYTRFCVTRYGNVAGSAGSVIPRWRSLGGRRAAVTDPECTRFWMRMDEAVSLVFDAAHDMAGGETYVPTLPAYRLGDLAAAMGVEYDVVGLPAHEKRHETMDGVTTSEQARRMSAQELRAALIALPP